MKTTIDLPDDIFKAAKKTAIDRGVSLKELITTAIKKELKA